MKKIINTLLCLSICTASVAFASNNVRIVNSDPQYNIEMTVQNCTVIEPKAPGSQTETRCDAARTVTVKSHRFGQNYNDFLVADDSEDADNKYTHFIHVATAKVANISVATSTFKEPKVCEADVTGDLIILDTYLTDHVVCNDRSHAGI
jgi:hypothetical protein